VLWGAAGLAATVILQTKKNQEHAPFRDVLRVSVLFHPANSKALGIALQWPAVFPYELQCTAVRRRVSMKKQTL
jgi:hypothetical protein